MLLSGTTTPLPGTAGCTSAPTLWCNIFLYCAVAEAQAAVSLGTPACSLVMLAELLEMLG